MAADSLDALALIATARVVTLLGDRDDLRLQCLTSSGGPAEQAVVLLATPLDDVHGLPPAAEVRIAVLEDTPAPFDDARFDDYVFASASRREIEFRARRALQRKAPAGLCLDPTSLRVGGVTVALSITEQRLLALLLDRRGAPVTRADLERAIGDAPDHAVRDTGRALDAHVYRLRRKLRALPGIHLDTLRQRGFSISVETPLAAAPPR